MALMQILPMALRRDMSVDLTFGCHASAEGRVEYGPWQMIDFETIEIRGGSRLK